jgi:deazaflavin-dependent oxidoreductase (nitroreductase family)
MGAVLTVVAWVVGVVAGIGGLFVLGMRGKWAIVQTPIRQLNKRFSNPRQMKTAGTPGAYAGIVRHVGRSSGKTYETPVSFVRTDEGYVAALVYGSGTDWMKNLLAAGEAELTVEGETHRVDEPTIVDADTALRWFSDSDLKTFRLMHIEEFLTVRLAA